MAANADGLPLPPYAAQGAAKSAGAPVAMDRYGGGTSHAITRRLATIDGAPASYAGPRLGWAGKTTAAVETGALHAVNAPRPLAPWASPFGARRADAALAPAASVQIAPQPAAVAEETPEARAAAMPPPRPRYGYPSMATYAAPSSPVTSPASIYDTPPPAAPASRVASNDQTPAGPRLYSVHRDYGMEPDPIPLAPQFFGPTADLTQPETAEVGHRTKTSTGAPKAAPDTSTDQ